MQVTSLFPPFFKQFIFMQGPGSRGCSGCSCIHIFSWRLTLPPEIVWKNDFVPFIFIRKLLSLSVFRAFLNNCFLFGTKNLGPEIFGLKTFWPEIFLGKRHLGQRFLFQNLLYTWYMGQSLLGQNSFLIIFSKNF